MPKAKQFSRSFNFDGEPKSKLASDDSITDEHQTVSAFPTRLVEERLGEQVGTHQPERSQYALQRKDAPSRTSRRGAVARGNDSQTIGDGDFGVGLDDVFFGLQRVSM